jgi:dihydroorotate dehydrogenase
MDLPRYDIDETYRWNYEHAPLPVELEVPDVPGDWRFLGVPVKSPIGIPAGPLLNGKWCLYHASLGFDVLTYKTVRSVARECFPLPNLLPVDCGSLTGDEASVPSSTSMRGSWAVSFGMPSAAPEVWRRDIEWTRKQLPAGKLLNVSVVGTYQTGWTIADLATDYARCAAWAIESGADCVETNLSCPNVSTCDGQLYQNPQDASLVVRCVRDAIGDKPFAVKIGHLKSREDAIRLLDAIAPSIDGIAMTNSVATGVTTESDLAAFNGNRRGICGAAIREASLLQIRMFAEICGARREKVSLIGCGGASTTDDVENYLAAGAVAVHIATAAMVNPLVGLEIKRQWRAAALAPFKLRRCSTMSSNRKP